MRCLAQVARQRSRSAATLALLGAGGVLFFWWGFGSGLRAPLDAARQVYQASAAVATPASHD